MRRAMLAVLISLAAAPVALRGQDASDLSNAIDTYFNLSVTPGQGPTLYLKSGGILGDGFRNLRDDLAAIGSVTDITTTISSINIRWVGTGGPVTWAEDNGILIVTAPDGGPLISTAEGTIQGDGSSIYVVAGHGLSGDPIGHGGNASARNTGAATTPGDCHANGGNGVNGGDGGFAFARNYARGWANCRGGASDGGDGGMATAIAADSSTDAVGGPATGNGKGGNAISKSGATWAMATGGSTEKGWGGNASAEGVTTVYAYGGNATSALDVASRGGNASAISVNDLAVAFAGYGNYGGKATSRSTNHSAFAWGGDGKGSGTVANYGGDADARSVNSSASAHGGDATTMGTGGTATADGSDPWSGPTTVGPTGVNGGDVSES